jgi:hypothetical protein
MTLIVDPNADMAAQARADLQKLCPDPAMTIHPTTGVVSYAATTGGAAPGCDLVYQLVNTSCRVTLEGRDASLFEDVRVNARGTIVHPLGIVHPLPAVGQLQVVYDASDCQGNGSWLWGRPAGPTSSGPVDNTPDSTLFHELTHALRHCTFADPAPGWDDPGTWEQRDQAEEYARTQENVYRAWRTPPLLPRLVTGPSAEIGGCKPVPAVYARTGTASTGDGDWFSFKTDCFVASAAYGSPFEPEVEMLRRVRDDVLRRTRAGSRFFEEFYEPYYRVSPAIVELMRRDKRVMEVVRWGIVHPVVSHLDQALRFPDAPLDDVPEPWRSFLTEMRDSLEEWAGAIEPARDLDGMSLGEAALELETALRYLFRTPESRSAYLSELEANGALPLRGSSDELRRVAERLRASGRSAAEVERMVGGGAAGMPLHDDGSDPV